MFIWNGVPDLMIVCPGVLVFKSGEHSAVLVFISIIYTVIKNSYYPFVLGCYWCHTFFAQFLEFGFKMPWNLKLVNVQQCQFLVYTDHRYMLQ